MIFIAKVKLNALYKAIYLSRSIRPNKYPKTECQIWCKARPSPSLSFLLLRGKFKQVYATWHCTLFVFQRDDPQQNGVKLLTPVSDLVFNALSDGTIHFALYGSSLNHNLIGWNNSNSQSESFVLVVLKAAMERKKKGTIWKSNENWVRNWCQKWHTILFTATNRENKQCHKRLSPLLTTFGQ